MVQSSTPKHNGCRQQWHSSCLRNHKKKQRGSQAFLRRQSLLSYSGNSPPSVEPDASYRLHSSPPRSLPSAKYTLLKHKPQQVTWNKFPTAFRYIDCC